MYCLQCVRFMKRTHTYCTLKCRGDAPTTATQTRKDRVRLEYKARVYQIADGFDIKESLNLHALAESLAEERHKDNDEDSKHSEQSEDYGFQGRVDPVTGRSYAPKDADLYIGRKNKDKAPLTKQPKRRMKPKEDARTGRQEDDEQGPVDAEEDNDLRGPPPAKKQKQQPKAKPKPSGQPKPKSKPPSSTSSSSRSPGTADLFGFMADNVASGAVSSLQGTKGQTTTSNSVLRTLLLWRKYLNLVK